MRRSSFAPGLHICHLWSRLRSVKSNVRSFPGTPPLPGAPERQEAAAGAAFMDDKGGNVLRRDGIPILAELDGWKG